MYTIRGEYASKSREKEEAYLRSEWDICWRSVHGSCGMGSWARWWGSVCAGPGVGGHCIILEERDSDQSGLEGRGGGRVGKHYATEVQGMRAGESMGNMRTKGWHAVEYKARVEAGGPPSCHPHREGYAMPGVAAERKWTGG